MDSIGNGLGNALIDKDLKALERGDSESLDVADKVAKSVRRRLRR